ncbi:CHAP domain-containing protein, partial [Aliicoccus persicus]
AAEQAEAERRAAEQAEAERRAAEQAEAERKAKEEAAAAAPAPAPSYGVNYYSGGQCTYYAFERRKQLGKPVGNNWGNAHNWANAARSQGYSVNNTPSVGAIMVFAQGQGGANSYYGHVAIVESVNGDGSINISEWNWTHGPWNKSVRTISASTVNSYNYIH